MPTYIQTLSKQKVELEPVPATLVSEQGRLVVKAAQPDTRVRSPEPPGRFSACAPPRRSRPSLPWACSGKKRPASSASSTSSS